MIHIERDETIPALAVYTEASVKALDGTAMVTKADQEQEKAKAFFTNPDNYHNDKKKTKKGFKFEVYKNPELVQKLDEIFVGKCAYCESRYGAVTPKDIEHFRPKSEIDNGTEKVKPGYWWLAGDWHNLLVSCPECNRPRRQRVPGQSEKVNRGKGSQFPLDDEHLRVRDHNGDVALEEPARLLLNPCLDNPEEHLTFDDLGLVHPRTIGGVPSEMGRVSIDVYALQRWDLVQERLVALNELKSKFRQLRHQVRMHGFLIASGCSEDELAENRNEMRILSEEIAKTFRERAPYLAMLREWVLKAKQAGEFDTLLQFGIDPEALIQG